MKEQSEDSINLGCLLRTSARFALFTLAIAIFLFSIQVKVSLYESSRGTETTAAMKFSSAEKSGVITNMKLREFGKLLPVFALVLFALKTACIWAVDRERYERSVYQNIFAQKHYPFLYHRPPPSAV
jgi:hypothetical protein